MANLDQDTIVTPTGDGAFSADLSPDWAVWGPNGGYLAAVALRAAGAATSLRAPASIHCQFLRIPAFGPVRIEVTSLVRSRRAESLRVDLIQRKRVMVTATVWAIAGGRGGPSRSWGEPPTVPGPTELGRIDEMVAAEGGPVLPIWQDCCEVRVAGWGGPERAAGRPDLFGWLRLVESVAFGTDPWLDGCRAVFATDAIAFPAIGQGFAAREMTFIAPSLDLYTAFHRETCADEWVLLDGRGAAAGGGVLCGQTRIWSTGGKLIASGSQQMLARAAGGPTF